MLRSCYLYPPAKTKLGLFSVIWILLVCLVPVSYQAACSGEVIGQSDPNNANVNSPGVTDTDATLAFVNQYHMAPCCGEVTRWEVYVEGAGTILPQIWRLVPGTTNTYTIIGYNSIRVTVTGINFQRRGIVRRFRIPVAPGDYIGVHTDGTAILRYDSCLPNDPVTLATCAEKVYRATGVGIVESGAQVTFDTLQSSTLGTNMIRNYAISATLGAKDAVSCTDRTFTTPDTLAVGSQISTVDTTNMDTNHVDSTFKILTTSPALPVQIDAQTGVVTTSGELSPAYPSTTYTITIEVVDVCGSTASCSLTVTVQNVAKPVEFTFLPAEQELYRYSEVPMDLRAFSLSRQRDSDDVTCSIISTTPTSDAFEIIQHNKTSYTAALKSTANMDTLEDVDVVVLLIGCENSGGEYGQSTLTLHLGPDKADKKIFWFLIGLFALLFCIALGCIIMACCVKTGVCKLWPSSPSSPSSFPSSKVNDIRHVAPYSDPKPIQHMQHMQHMNYIPTRETPPTLLSF